MLSLMTLPTSWVFGQTQVDWPSSPFGTPLGYGSQLHDFVRYIYEWGVSLGGIVVFVMLVWAGIQYLVSAGNSGIMLDARKRIKSAILGLILLLASFLILNTINPQLTKLKELPSLYLDEIALEKMRKDMLGPPPPPCDFIVIWSEQNYKGTKSEPIRFPNESDQVYRIEDEQMKDYLNKDWMSGKSFIKLSQNEIKKIEKGIIDIQRYDENGNLKKDGDYKEGGFCTLHLFRTTDTWWTRANPCGGINGSVQFPARNFKLLQPRDENITCVELARILEDSKEGKGDKIKDTQLNPGEGGPVLIPKTP